MVKRVVEVRLIHAKDPKLKCLDVAVRISSTIVE